MEAPDPPQGPGKPQGLLNNLTELLPEIGVDLPDPDTLDFSSSSNTSVGLSKALTTLSRRSLKLQYSDMLTPKSTTGPAN